MKRILIASFLLIALSTAQADEAAFNAGYCAGYRKAINEFHDSWIRWDNLVNILNPESELVRALRSSVKHFIHKGNLPDEQPFAFRSATAVVTCEGRKP